MFTKMTLDVVLKTNMTSENIQMVMETVMDWK